MNTAELIAIDVHARRGVVLEPLRQLRRGVRPRRRQIFRQRPPADHRRDRPTTARKIGLVMFTVDSEAQLGQRRIPNEEICGRRKNSDMMIAFASIDPHKGKMGARERAA